MTVHFIGICGTAMATLAALYKRRGHVVRGSDAHVYPPMSDFLAPAEGISVFDGFKAEQIGDDIDLVIVGNAISRGNVELEAVLDRKQRYCSLPEAIRDQFLWDRRSIVIAGTHGKTTTTALTTAVLLDAGRDPSALIGGISANLGSSYRLGSGPEFVIEGDEYDSAYFDKTAKFLKYLPDIALVGNVEFDHADIYPDLDAILLAFRRFLALVPRTGLTVLGTDGEHVRALLPFVKSRLVTVGLEPGADWRAERIRSVHGLTAFDVWHDGAPWATVETTLLGAHNVRNILATIAIAHDLGISREAVVAGVRGFRGVKRRMEVRGEVDGITVYDDFAHHPTAIRETLNGVRAARPESRIWAVFEPRSATSCRKVFQDEFSAAFDAADESILAAVFRSNLPEDQRLSGEAVIAGINARGHKARLVPTVPGIVDVISAEAKPGDLVVIMSNGGFEGIHGRLLTALRERRHA